MLGTELGPSHALSSFILPASIPTSNLSHERHGNGCPSVTALVGSGEASERLERNVILRLFQAVQFMGCVHFTDGETEVPKGEVTYLWLHRIRVFPVQKGALSSRSRVQQDSVYVCVDVYSV